MDQENIWIYPFGFERGSAIPLSWCFTHHVEEVSYVAATQCEQYVDKNPLCGGVKLCIRIMKTGQ